MTKRVLISAALLALALALSAVSPLAAVALGGAACGTLFREGGER